MKRGKFSKKKPCFISIEITNKNLFSFVMLARKQGFTNNSIN